jgi:hypothetical protein
MNTGTRAAYVKRFGQSGGAKKIDHVIRRPDVRDAIAQDPVRYDPKSAEGRMNILRDLANPRTDDLMEMALWEAQDMGARPEDVTAMRGLIENIAGRQQSSAFADRTSALITAFTYIALLPRVVMTAATEPISVLMRTGDIKAAGTTMVTYMGEAFRSAKTTQERAGGARARGLPTTPPDDEVLMNRVAGDGQTALQTDHIMARFFRANGLAQITNAQRRAAMVGLFYWMHGMAKSINSNTTSDTKKDIARAEFRELGIPAEHIQSFADWLAQHDDPPTLDELETGPGSLFVPAIARAVDQTITNPRRADKAMYSTTPIGRLTYALTHFSLTYFRNVHLANYHRAQRNYKIARDRGATIPESTLVAALPVTRSLALGFGGMIIAQMVVGAFREWFFNNEQWEEKGEDEEGRFWWLFNLAVSRSGFYGGADPLVNAYTGLRYERDLANMAVGPGVGYIMSNTQNIIKGLPGSPRNSENTNTAEHTALKSFYRLTIAPLSNWMLSAMPAPGAAGWATRYAAMIYMSSNSASSGFADTIVGPAGTKEKDK